MASNEVTLLFSAVQSDGGLVVEAAPAAGCAEIHPAGEISTLHLSLRMTAADAERLVEALYSRDATVLVETVSPGMQWKESVVSTARNTDCSRA